MNYNLGLHQANQYVPMGYAGHPYMHAVHPFLGLGGLILGVLFWILVIWLVIALFHLLMGGLRHQHNGCGNPHKEKEAFGNKEAETKPDSSYLRIVKERYARGEINKEEFEQKKIDLA